MDTRDVKQTQPQTKRKAAKMVNGPCFVHAYRSTGGGKSETWVGRVVMIPRTKKLLKWQSHPPNAAFVSVAHLAQLLETCFAQIYAFGVHAHCDICTLVSAHSIRGEVP